MMVADSLSLSGEEHGAFDKFTAALGYVSLPTPNEDSTAAAGVSELTGHALPQHLQVCSAMTAGEMCDGDFLGLYGAGTYDMCKTYAGIFSIVTGVEHVNASNDATITEAQAEAAIEMVATLDTARFVVYGILLHAVCVLGVLGNGATLVVLREREFGRSSSTVYLKVMMAFDILYLLANYEHYVLISGLQLAQWDTSPLPAYSRIYVVYVLSDFFRNVGVLLTVAATVERYIFIRHSMHASKLCTARRARIASAACVVTAACLQVPRALTARVQHLPVGGGDRSIAGANVTCATLAAASIDEDGAEYVIVNDYSLVSADFDMAQGYFSIVVFLLLPVVGLTVMTGVLLHAIGRSNALRRSLSASPGPGKSSRSLEININAVLLSVVVTFIVCSLPMLVISIIRMDDAWEPFFHSTVVGAILYYAALTVLNVNAAINVLLFCVFGKKFRRQFRKTFLSFGATSHSRPAASSMKAASITASLRRSAAAADAVLSDSPETSQTLLNSWTKGSTRSCGGVMTPTGCSPAVVPRRQRQR